jgi:hypothetical protein
MAKEKDIDLESFKEEINKVSKEQGIEVPAFPLENVPTYEDLQVLGSLLKNPDIACLPSFKKLIYPLRSVFSLRLTLDLLNIPTGQAEIEDLCARQKNTTRKNTNTKQKGGVYRKKTRRLIAS